MNTFLEYVAKDIIKKFGTDLSHIAVVFPNKRASLFMNEYFAKICDKPIWSPSYITISDLFRQHSNLIVGDQIKLICDLYKVFIKTTGIDETLDHFYGWGQLLLADFDDIDKNMADAQKVFANLKDIHELDDISYLTEEQKEIIKKFFSNFTEDHNSELKKRFLSLWSHFEDLYNNFNQLIESEGISYEGALYRKVACDETIDFKYDTYIFIGFNVIQRVEQRLFDTIKKKGMAKFYWDFDTYYMNNNNEAGHYIKQHLAMFPNELDNKDKEIYENLRKPKDISYLSATTDNIQARYISKWLRKNDRISAGKKTAIVMCDESLLKTVIHCLPPEVDKVNITTGYPLSQSPISSLITGLISLQTIGKVKGTDKFRLHYINAVLDHPYAKYISYKYNELRVELNEHKRYFPSRKELTLYDENGLDILFSDIETVSMEGQNKAISKWLLSLIKLIGQNSKDQGDILFLESIFRVYTLINRIYGLICSGDLVVDQITFTKLINQLIKTTSIPFHGEPAIGIQIMGVLETRNLDFDHVLVLSCNEGNMPKTVNDSSFIPYSIRKAYGLTTIDNKVAIYAYYFHSLIQRAKDITITYNNATEDGHTGEMSRFMLQLMVESNHNIKQIPLQARQIPLMTQPKEIVKTGEIMNALNEISELSPTAINNYIRCQLLFYYKNVAKIKEPDTDDEDCIDNRAFGNIFHKSAELLYSRGLKLNKHIKESDIVFLLNHREQLDIIVDQAFREELFKVKDNGFHPEYNGLQIINREVVIRYLQKLLRIDEKLAPFTILDVESKVEKEIIFDTDHGTKMIKLFGIIDRVDEINKQPDGQRIRVVDYKTGHSPSGKVSCVKDIFSSENITKNHSDYFLQTFLYSLAITNSKQLNPNNIQISPALLFIQNATIDEYDPTLTFSTQRNESIEKITDINKYRDDFMNILKSKLNAIFSHGSFRPSEDKTICANCPYNRMCGS